MSEEKTVLSPSPLPAEPEPGGKPKRPRLLWLLWGVLALAALAVLGLSIVSARYRDRFLHRTQIAGIDVSSLTAAQAGERLTAAAEGVRVELRDSGGEEILTLPLTAFVGADALREQADTLFAQQHRDAGALAWMSGGRRVYSPTLIGEPDTAGLLHTLDQALYGDTPRVQPRDAYIELGETGYTVVPEVPGNLVDLLRCAQAVADALRGTEELTPRTISATAEDALLRPAVTADSRRLQRRCEVMDAYLATPVTLDFQNGSVYTLTPEDIWSVSTVEWTVTSAVCTPEPELVYALADRLAEDYASDGVYAKFRNVEPTREYVYYRVGDRGWILDREKLGADTLQALRSGEGGDVTPDYDYTWYWQNYYGCGDTFVEISIDNQYMWYFLNGELLVETPVVTGNLSTGGGDVTRRGFFSIYYKVEDVFLSGPTWYDHVDYWMPFDGGIGLHDSSWRDAYGGDIYITDGSHGCINTPLEAIGIIYDNIWDGVPVIVY